ncbi:MAG: 30S ribosomal protein S4 [Deltaproteobacteria bacterium]|jgi:small subunit ribosomal protein S4|nr:30S ribosomal protein S4 [Deltaproteobacteria bacterium]
MARYCGAVCRLCRREGEKLFLKGDRCYSTKCALERRDSAPGQHGRNRGRISEYKLQLREKQKTRRMYGVMEKQFRLMFYGADRQKGITGENLLVALETRLDNVVYKAGFAASKSEARQFVVHCHFLINGKVVNIPSYRLKVGDVLTVKEKSKNLERINMAINGSSGRIIAEWLEVDHKNFSATVKALPVRQQLPQSVKEQLIVELYSK